MTVGENIRAFRKKQGLSQRELGEKVGKKQQQIGQYEAGTRSPKINTIKAIANALGCSVNDLQPRYTEDPIDPVFEWIDQHLPIGYELRNSEDDGYLWLTYPDGSSSFDITKNDLNEIIAECLKYMEYRLAVLKK